MIAAKSHTKTYREGIGHRFIICMRQIIAERKNDCRTIKDFAGMVGEFPQNITKIERGERFPTLDQVARLCELFGFAPAWVLLGEGEMKQNIADKAVPARVLRLETRVKGIEKQLVKGLVKAGKTGKKSSS